MALVDTNPLRDEFRSASQCSSASVSHRRASQSLPVTPPSPFKAPDVGTYEDIEGMDLERLHLDGMETWDAMGKMAALGLGLNKSDGRRTPEPATTIPQLALDLCDADCQPSAEPTEPTAERARGPFHKWMKTLHRRAAQRQTLASETAGLSWQFYDTDDSISVPRRIVHEKSSSGSSFGFVTAVKSASISLASASAATRSRKNAGRSRGYSRGGRSSGASEGMPRFSEDGSYVERPVTADPALVERSLQRRRVLEELISTEESYIADVRFLMNVYVTILASLPTLPVGLRSSINRNLAEIVELHEEILGELHRTVPDSEYTQMDIRDARTKPGVLGHRRWRSLDAVPEDTNGMSWLHQVPGMVADPQVAGEVAKIFGKKMNRLFVYKEYGAKYELMIKDVASAHRAMPQWDTYQKGLEALAATLESINSSKDQPKKSLTIGDLLVKPIQRVCRYPLLFAELLKYTPVTDCPNSNMEVENVLIRLREATAEINRATNDVGMKETLERTWLLQDRLVFPNQRLDATSKNRVRSFGHIQLCGVLHACWQTRDSVEGQYMVCLLYRDVLCLASAGKADQIYTAHACLSLRSIKVEEIDNARGLQCHTAPHSWKLVFECDHQLYEILMTACTAKEESVWRAHLDKGVSGAGDQEAKFYNSLSLNIKTLGSVFGKPGTMARRLSIHRATTVGPKSPMCQVILKNTCIPKEASNSTSGSSINRSQSLLSTSRIPVLAPPRGERARLEAILSDVWSREHLPFPGMTARSRSEHLVRASASSMMRKLSMTSIANSFAKRSNSLRGHSWKNVRGGEEREGEDNNDTTN